MTLHITQILHGMLSAYSYVYMCVLFIIAYAHTFAGREGFLNLSALLKGAAPALYTSTRIDGKTKTALHMCIASIR